MRVLLLILLFLPFWAGSSLRAQTPDGDIYTLLRAPVEGAGKAEIRQPRKLAEALSNYRAKNAQHPGMDGFRVRIYRDLGRDARLQSQVAMDKALTQFEGLRAYMTFDSPYYKVSVGDCRTRFEAYVLRQKLLGLFPRSFVVTERINFPPTR